MCNRALLLFGKLPQWNLHVNCHVNGTTFQSGLRSQTGLSSLRVSCKRALRYFWPVPPFYTSWKKTKTIWFSDIFRRCTKETLTWNELTLIIIYLLYIRSGTYLWHQFYTIRYTWLRIDLPWEQLVLLWGSRLKILNTDTQLSLDQRLLDVANISSLK